MNRGDIVEVDWPYSDLSGTKKRPAVVVRADFLDGLTDNVARVRRPAGILLPSPPVLRAIVSTQDRREGDDPPPRIPLRCIALALHCAALHPGLQYGSSYGLRGTSHTFA